MQFHLGGIPDAQDFVPDETWKSLREPGPWLMQLFARLLFYAHYDGEVTRNRFIAILALPTVILTLLPLTIAIATNSSHELVAWISTWNILFACGDLFGIGLLFFQLQRSTICRNQGWRTYWKSGSK
jgi:hypothetical protein